MAGINFPGTEVTNILVKDSQVIRNYVKLHKALLPTQDGDLVQITPQFNMGLITAYEVINEVVDKWKSAAGHKEATIAKFVEKLRKAGPEFLTAADAIERTFMDPIDRNMAVEEEMPQLR